MKKLVLLGSTGSIGTQTLEVVDYLAPQWEILALTANTQIELLLKQAKKYSPKYVVVMNEKKGNELKYKLKDTKIKVLMGMTGLEFVASLTTADLVVNALVGAVGLKPTMATLQADLPLALANKESLVIGGEIIQEYIDKKNPPILPIDSEHNAIFQILAGHQQEEINKLILTASGGPFRNLTYQELKNVTVEQALNHPNWDMGGKISIDSATLMNKGLEVIEAHFLFQQAYENIEVVIHPESIIHSLVEFKDKAIMAELGVADMCLAIQNVMTYPKRQESKIKSLDLLSLGQLTFSSPDTEKFPSLDLAYAAGIEGASFPIVLNGANEIAVKAFLEKRIPFIKIPQIIEKVMNKHKKVNNLSLSLIYEIDAWARKITEEVIVDVNNHC